LNRKSALDAKFNPSYHTSRYTDAALSFVALRRTNMNIGVRSRLMLLVVFTITITVVSTRLNADTGMCGGANITLPFTDVPSTNIFFCSIAEAFFSGLTNGATSTTYNPSAPVPREQMAAFVSRTMDQSVKRSSERAVLDQFWTTQGADSLGITTVGGNPGLLKSDGTDLWVVNGSPVIRVRASDGRVLQTWTDASNAAGVLVAMGKVFVTGYPPDPTHGILFEIDPTQAPGAVSTVTTNLGASPGGIAYDGQRIWTANSGSQSSSGSLSMVTFNPVTVKTVQKGFVHPFGVVFDGASIWVTDGDNTLKKVDSSGNILLSISVGLAPKYPAFDGTNIWVPNAASDSVSVVRGTGGLAGTMLATLTGNGLNAPVQAAFDGERILVTNQIGDSVSLWKASDLTPIGTFSAGSGTHPYGACSDGLNFWITLSFAGKLARF
jgi:hypothetical protein